MNIIELIPYGKENAISRTQLCALSGLNDRMMRQQIEAAREYDVIINLCDGNGYFRPKPEECALVKEYVMQEESRLRSIAVTLRPARKFVKEVSECKMGIT